MATKKIKEIAKPDSVTNAIWKKMTPIQKEIFVDKYEQFLSELKTLASIQLPIQAHNLAYLVATSIH